MTEPPLQLRFRDHLRSTGIGEAPEAVLVASSGGLDSTVLLHLLVFYCRDLPLRLTVAHFDHRMREGSEADADWLAGLCRAWEMPLLRGAAEVPPRGEESARRQRYTFLRSAAARAGASLIFTAHHADDQAETVLFRVLRGTGLRGLRGIPARTESGLVRPLLPFWREELERYARSQALAWRRDPSNEVEGPARNRIRLHHLPEIERTFAPSARRNLVALAELVREAEQGWASLVEPIRESLVRREGDAVLLARRELRQYHPAITSRLLRDILRSFGVVLGRAGTRSTLQFITDAPSGREMHLPRGVRVRTEHERARIETGRGAPREDSSLPISSPEPSEPFAGRIRIAGRDYEVAARVEAPDTPAPAEGRGWRVRIATGEVSFPLQLRGRMPGDRVRTGAGSRSLKKLMIDRRVPLSERAGLPVLADAQGSVVWVAGLVPLKAPLASDVVIDIVAADG